jgi:hypothetical protein
MNDEAPEERIVPERCCCGHPPILHRGFTGKCLVTGCDCFNLCDCHLIAAEIRREWAEETAEKNST